MVSKSLLGAFLGLCLLSIPFLMPPEKVTVWAWSDAHVNVLESTSLADAVSQVEGFPWDFYVNAGDTFGFDCPSQEDAQEVWEQLGDIALLGYHVLGNHDPDPDSAQTFREYLSPWSYTPPYSVTGQWDRYSFEVGNVLFLMLSDRNYPFEEAPFARPSCGAGSPAGRHTPGQFLWWKNRVEDNPDKIIITVAHHALEDTTAYTGMDEGFEEGIHSAFSWFDQAGSSFIYAIGDHTTDGRTSQFPGGPPVMGPIPEDYRGYLAENPGAISIWLHGHTHWTLDPDSRFNGRGMEAVVSEVLFMNLGAITTHHAPPDVAFSRFLQFTDGSTHVSIKTWLHEEWNGNPIGFYETFNGPTSYDLGREFSAP